MVKVTFIDPIDTLSGKIARRHRTTYYVRSAATSNEDMLENPCYTSARNPRKKIRLTAGQRAWNQTFAEITNATRERMMDPNHIALDQLAFRKQTKYKTWYQYVWNLMRQELEGKQK